MTDKQIYLLQKEITLFLKNNQDVNQAFCFKNENFMQNIKHIPIKNKDYIKKIFVFRDKIKECAVEFFSQDHFILNEILSNRKNLVSFNRETIQYFNFVNLNKDKREESIKEINIVFDELQKAIISNNQDNIKKIILKIDISFYYLKKILKNIQTDNKKYTQYKELLKLLSKLQNTIVYYHLRLVSRIIYEYNIYYDYEDIFQEGVLGLIKAFLKYDLCKKTAFTTFSTFWIKQHIKRYFSNKKNIIKIPENIINNYLQIQKIKSKNEEKELVEQYQKVISTMEISLEIIKRIEKIVSSNKTLLFSSLVTEENKDSSIEDLFSKENDNTVLEELINDDLTEKILKTLKNFLSEKEMQVLLIKMQFEDESILSAKTKREKSKLEKQIAKKIRHPKIIKEIKKICC